MWQNPSCGVASSDAMSSPDIEKTIGSKNSAPKPVAQERHDIGVEVLAAG